MSHLSQTMRIEIPPDLKEELQHRGLAQQPASPPAGTAGPALSAEIGGRVGTAAFQALFHSVYDAALITQLDGRIVDANTRASDFLQQSLDELRQRNLITIISGADASTLQTLQANVDGDRFVLIQAYCARKDGTLFPAEIAVNHLSVRKDVYFCCFIRDVTLRRQAEEMLRTVHNAIQNASTGIAISNLAGRITYVNQAAVAMWGREKKDDMLGRTITDLMPDTDQTRTMLAAVRAGRGWTGEIVITRKDGSPLQLQVSATENRDTDEERVGMVFSFLDISDRKRAETAEKQAERQRIMMESIGAACHHLGQPATVLLASLELLTRKRDGNQSTIDELLKSSMAAAESLRSMLHKLNDIAEYQTAPYIAPQVNSGHPEATILSVGTGPGSGA